MHPNLEAAPLLDVVHQLRVGSEQNTVEQHLDQVLDDSLLWETKGL